MQYQFTCPLEGCDQTMVVDAQNEEEAAQKLTNSAKMHLSQKHPEIKKTDEEVMTDIKSMMKSVPPSA